MKRMIITLLIMLCTLGFTACGNAESASDTDSSDAVVQTQAQQTQTAEQTHSSDDKSASSQASSGADTSQASSDTHKDTIVIYFSATGTTKGVAQRIASVTNADIYEIVPAQPYSSADLDWHDEKSRSTIEMNDSSARPGIAGDKISLDGYKTVYIGYPIWWGDAPRIMSTFVEAYSFEGKTVIPFCTSGSSPIGRSGSNLASQAGSGKWLGGKRLAAGMTEDEIKSWINELK